MGCALKEVKSAQTFRFAWGEKGHNDSDNKEDNNSDYSTVWKVTPMGQNRPGKILELKKESWIMKTPLKTSGQAIYQSTNGIGKMRYFGKIGKLELYLTHRR